MPQSPIKLSTINILINLLGRIAIQVHEAELDEQQKKMTIDQMQQGIGGLHGAMSIFNNGMAFNEPQPNYKERYYPHQSGWQDIISEEIAQFNSHGSAYITRVSECLIKTFGLINIHQGDTERSLALFRGQHNAEWGIISSVGLTIPPEEVPEDKLSVSRYEIDLLRTWQETVRNKPELQEEIFGPRDAYDINDPRWWSIKQHYEGKTRLIDWTSSPLCALYFACVDWDGTIDSNIDGGLYALMHRPGRRFVSKDAYESVPANQRDVHDCAGSKVSDYFNLQRHYDVVRSVVGEADSDRQLSQDGHYIFSPRFSKYIDNWTGPKPFFFVILKECKIPILRELYSIGYTPEKIVRGHKGKIAQRKLMEQLGIRELRYQE